MHRFKRLTAAKEASNLQVFAVECWIRWCVWARLLAYRGLQRALKHSHASDDVSKGLSLLLADLTSQSTPILPRAMFVCLVDGLQHFT